MDAILLTLALVCLVFLLTKATALYNYFIFLHKINKIPGPGTFPGLANVVRLYMQTPHERMKWLVKRNLDSKSGISKLWVGLHPFVRIRKPEHLEVVLSSTTHISKSILYSFINPWVGQGLLTSTGEKWFRDRKFITPAFHFNILEQYAVVMHEKVQLMVKKLEEMRVKNPEEPIDIFRRSIMCTLDIICETAMGLNVHAQEETENEYVESLHRFSKMVFERMITPWGRSEFLYWLTPNGRVYYNAIATMHKLTNKVIKERKAMRQQKNGIQKENHDDSIGIKKRKAFLDLLLDANETAEYPLTDEELREHVDTFMFTGHDTTAAAAAWCLFCLGNNLDIQEKVAEEIDEVLGDSTALPTSKQLSELKHLDRAIREALRLYPSAPEISRKLTTDLVFDDGIVIPAGATLGMSAFMTHRDSEVWKDPLKFDPDRFLPENSKHRHPYAYVPFSAGPRNCIGQKFAQLEEKILLSAILRKFRVKAIETPDQIKIYSGMILRPVEGIFVTLTPRK